MMLFLVILRSKQPGRVHLAGLAMETGTLQMSIKTENVNVNSVFWQKNPGTFEVCIFLRQMPLCNRLPSLGWQTILS